MVRTIFTYVQNFCVKKHDLYKAVGIYNKNRNKHVFLVL